MHNRTSSETIVYLLDQDSCIANLLYYIIMRIYNPYFKEIFKKINDKNTDQTKYASEFISELESRNLGRAFKFQLTYFLSQKDNTKAKIYLKNNEDKETRKGKMESVLEKYFESTATKLKDELLTDLESNVDQYNELTRKELEENFFCKILHKYSNIAVDTNGKLIKSIRTEVENKNVKIFLMNFSLKQDYELLYKNVLGVKEKHQTAMFLDDLRQLARCLKDGNIPCEVLPFSLVDIVDRETRDKVFLPCNIPDEVKKSPPSDYYEIMENLSLLTIHHDQFLDRSLLWKNVNNLNDLKDLKIDPNKRLCLREPQQELDLGATKIFLLKAAIAYLLEKRDLPRPITIHIMEDNKEILGYLPEFFLEKNVPQEISIAFYRYIGNPPELITKVVGQQSLEKTCPVNELFNQVKELNTIFDAMQLDKKAFIDQLENEQIKNTFKNEDFEDFKKVCSFLKQLNEKNLDLYSSKNYFESFSFSVFDKELQKNVLQTERLNLVKHLIFVVEQLPEVKSILMKIADNIHNNYGNEKKLNRAQLFNYCYFPSSSSQTAEEKKQENLSYHY